MWLLPGGMHGYSGGVCGCSRGGGHAWLLLGGGHVWQRGDVHGKGGHVWQGGHALRRGGMHGERGVCMAKGGHAWRKGGGCTVRDTAGHCAGGTHLTGMHSCFVCNSKKGESLARKMKHIFLKSIRFDC